MVIVSHCRHGVMRYINFYLLTYLLTPVVTLLYRKSICPTRCRMKCVRSWKVFYSEKSAIEWAAVAQGKLC